MRILHVTSFYEPAYSRGGRAVAAAMLARGQVREKSDVTVFTTNAGLPDGLSRDVGGVDRDGVRVHYFPTRSDSRIFFSGALLRACVKRVREFDVVHIHGLWNVPGTWGALVDRWAHVPYVLTPHGMLNTWSTRFRAYKKVPYWYAIERHTVRGAAWFPLPAVGFADQWRLRGSELRPVIELIALLSHIAVGVACIQFIGTSGQRLRWVVKTHLAVALVIALYGIYQPFANRYDLLGDSLLREVLVSRGRLRLSNFTWEGAAERTLFAYRLASSR